MSLITPCICFPGGSVIKNPPAIQETWGVDPWVGKIFWRRKWQPTEVFFPGKSQGQRNLVARVHGISRELNMA